MFFWYFIWSFDIKSSGLVFGDGGGGGGFEYKKGEDVCCFV